MAYCLRLFLFATFIIFVFPINSFASRIPQAKAYELLVGDHRLKDKLNILAFGDAGKASKAQYMIGEQMFQTCKREGCDFALSLGDNIYPRGVKNIRDKKFQTAFELPYKRFSLENEMDFWMALGNHDWAGNTSAQINYSFYSKLWRMPNRYFSVPYLPNWLHIYVLDTDRTYNSKWYSLSKERSFLRNFKKQLNEARKHLCHKPGWKILAGHHPIYSTGRKKNKKKEKRLRRAMQALMDDCKVDLYLSGHEHHLEHIETPTFYSIISGSAAEFRDTPERRIEDDQVKSIFRATQLGFVRLEVLPLEIKIFYYDSNGEVIYSFSRYKR